MSGYPLRTPRIALVANTKSPIPAMIISRIVRGFLACGFCVWENFTGTNWAWKSQRGRTVFEPQMPHQLKRSRRMFSFILTFKEKLMSCDIFNYKRQIV